MSDEQGNFTIYNEWWSGMQLLSREQRGDLLTALMAFNGADDCEMPEMDQATACIFEMVKRKNSSSCSRDERVREQTRERVRRFRARRKSKGGNHETLVQASR